MSDLFFMFGTITVKRNHVLAGISFGGNVHQTHSPGWPKVRGWVGGNMSWRGKQDVSDKPGGRASAFGRQRECSCGLDMPCSQGSGVITLHEWPRVPLTGAALATWGPGLRPTRHLHAHGPAQAAV